VTPEPASKRAVVFVDGQNLFYAARTAFGYPFPNYDVRALAGAICQTQGWQLAHVRFYTGVPDRYRDPASYHFWTAKLAQMGRNNITVFSRPLRYRNHIIRQPNGRTYTAVVGSEKGIDVRLAIDVIRLAFQRVFEVALILSQDQDLSEVARELRVIAGEQERWIKIASAFPGSPVSHRKRGINGTDWIKINRSLYDSCLDSRDYRPKKQRPKHEDELSRGEED
jgi:uncharacterized LabA/DUF88 family protein